MALFDSYRAAINALRQQSLLQTNMQLRLPDLQPILLPVHIYDMLNPLAQRIRHRFPSDEWLNDVWMKMQDAKAEFHERHMQMIGGNAVLMNVVMLGNIVHYNLM